jgi:hypothetical protein
MVMRDFLPPGWRGVLLGAFFAAYMSTISTQLNWGTSYIVNDFYRRFVRSDGTDQHYVWVSRIATIGTMIVAAVVTFYLESIRQAWEFVLESGAGIGLVLILRWYWWRVNAWSEIAAMVAPALGFLYLKIFTSIAFPYTLLYLVAWTTVCWVIVTFATPPEPEAHLIAFYRRVRPGGPGWGPIARKAGGPPPEAIGSLLVDWVAGWILIYAVLFGIGSAVLGSIGTALACFGVAAISTFVISRDLSRRGWKSVVE